MIQSIPWVLDIFILALIYVGEIRFPFDSQELIISTYIVTSISPNCSNVTKAQNNQLVV